MNHQNFLYILNLDFNDRKILNKMYLRIKSLVDLDMEIKQKLETKFIDMYNLLDTVLIEFPFDFNYQTEMDMVNIFKLYGIRLYSEGQTFMEKILCFIDLISLLDLCKLLIFCNIKSFFTDMQIEEIFKHIIHNKLYVLMIEGNLSEENLLNEKRIRIDSEFEEYEM